MMMRTGLAVVFSPRLSPSMRKFSLAELWQNKMIFLNHHQSVLYKYFRNTRSQCDSYCLYLVGRDVDINRNPATPQSGLWERTCRLWSLVHADPQQVQPQPLQSLELFLVTWDRTDWTELHWVRHINWYDTHRISSCPHIPINIIDKVQRKVCRLKVTLQMNVLLLLRDTFLSLISSKREAIKFFT